MQGPSRALSRESSALLLPPSFAVAFFFLSFSLSLSLSPSRETPRRFFRRNSSPLPLDWPPPSPRSERWIGLDVMSGERDGRIEASNDPHSEGAFPLSIFFAPRRRQSSSNGPSAASRRFFLLLPFVAASPILHTITPRLSSLSLSHLKNNYHLPRPRTRPSSSRPDRPTWRRRARGAPRGPRGGRRGA